MSQGELAALVATRLKENKIDVVLCGGACVSLYTSGSYVSLDIDFLDNGVVSRKAIRTVLAAMGFREKGRYFVHPETTFPVEFPRGPAMVGEERPRRIDEMKFSTGTLRLLSPTDCVKDRLTWYYYDNDLQALEQAKAVTQENPVDIDEVERWSRNEGMLEKFLEIKPRLLEDGPCQTTGH
jgi:hypothetical protein